MPMLNVPIDMRASADCGHPVLRGTQTRPVPGMRSRGTDLGTRRCDLLWPDANVAIEYDSDYAHSGSEQIARDAMRRNELSDIGIKVLVVTKRQLFDEKAFDVVARQLGRALGRRVRPASASQAEARRSLLEGMRASLTADVF